MDIPNEITLGNLGHSTAFMSGNLKPGGLACHVIAAGDPSRSN